jgi:hypothetical protein
MSTDKETIFSIAVLFWHSKKFSTLMVIQDSATLKVFQDSGSVKGGFPLASL